ncbi:MAG: hypothetical protein OXR68_07805 [Alphaproteobacteria bacterium]|nr:hypothetical protein [Alphaproteobacteria bacterium]MDD9920509.1 hypothetical protein [Alphaproteobacteria bacterium]
MKNLVFFMFLAVLWPFLVVAQTEKLDAKRQEELAMLKTAAAWVVQYNWNGEQGKILVIPGKRIQALENDSGVEYMFDIQHQKAFLRFPDDENWYSLPVSAVKKRLYLLPAFVDKKAKGPDFLQFPTKVLEVKDIAMNDCGKMTVSSVTSYLTGVRLVDLIRFTESIRLAIGGLFVNSCEFYDVRLFEWGKDSKGGKVAKNIKGWSPVPIAIDFPDKRSFRLTGIVPIMDEKKLPDLVQPTNIVPFTPEARLSLMTRFFGGKTFKSGGKTMDFQQIRKLLDQPNKKLPDLPPSHPFYQGNK